MSAEDNDEYESLEALVAERDLLASELAERTAQLRTVIRELHGANQQLQRLRGTGVGASSIDWQAILGGDSSTPESAID